MTIGHQFVQAPPETLAAARAIPTQPVKPSNSNVSPGYEILTRNLFVSPAYARTEGGGGVWKMSARPSTWLGTSRHSFCGPSPLVTRHWLARFFHYVSYANPRGMGCLVRPAFFPWTSPAPTGRLLRASKGNRMDLSARVPSTRLPSKLGASRGRPLDFTRGKPGGFCLAEPQGG